MLETINQIIITMVTIYKTSQGTINTKDFLTIKDIIVIMISLIDF